MGELVAFSTVASIVLISSWMVARGRNLVHSILWLALLLVGTAAYFVLMEASFLAGIQVMVYAGGVVTLMLFAVMLTRRGSGVWVENEVVKGRRIPAGIVAVALFALLARAITLSAADFPEKPAIAVTTKQVGTGFLTSQVLAFEVLSVLLLAATIGAIVIARRRDFGDEGTSVAQELRQRVLRRIQP